MQPNGGTLRRFVAVVGMIGAGLALLPGPASAGAGPIAAGQITTFAGGLGSGGPLDVAQRPTRVAVSGSLVYTSDADNYVVRVFDMVSGAQRVVAGNGTMGSSGDGGPATSAQLLPGGLAVDAAGNLFVSDVVYHRIRKVDPAGRITTIAGTGEGGFSGDGAAATAARLASPDDLAFDLAGNLLLTDGGNARIRRINPLGVITTLAGNGVRGQAGDGGPALAAEVDVVSTVTVGPQGDVIINGLNRIRRIGLDGVITTIAGTGEPSRSGTIGLLGDGDGGPATLARLSASAVRFDLLGNLYLSDYRRVRKIDTAGVITTVAGNGQGLYSGDGGPAIQAGVTPAGLAVDFSNRLYVADESHNRVRRIGLDGIITTVAGNGSRGPVG